MLESPTPFMNVTAPRPVRRSRRVALLCLAGSAAALGAIVVYFEVAFARSALAAARAEAVEQVLRNDAETPPSVQRQVGRAALAVLKAVEDQKIGTGDEIGTGAEPHLTVPDFKGKRLSFARREGRKLGLVVVARDGSGDRVSSDAAHFYRVRRQLTAAGTAAEPGDTVEVRVREIGGTSEGY